MNIEALLVGIPALFLAVVLHEIAHGYVAERLGDPTARSAGRITLNPIKHIDPIMTIAVPVVLIAAGSPIVFGAAKPVPVDPRYFRDPRRGMVWVAIAGPLVNFALMLISFVCLQGVLSVELAQNWIPAAAVLVHFLFQMVIINLVLGLFNLIPVPPLDGGRIAVGLLPLSLARSLQRLEPYGFLIVIALIAFGGFEALLMPVLEFVQGQIG